MPDELIVALEDEETLFALIVAPGSPGESSAVLALSSCSSRCSLIGRGLVFVDLPCLLPGVLEPHHNHPWAQAQQLGQVLQVVILGVGVVFEELLQDFDLVVCEPGPVGSLARGDALRAGGPGRLVGGGARKSVGEGVQVVWHVGEGGGGRRDGGRCGGGDARGSGGRCGCCDIGEGGEVGEKAGAGVREGAGASQLGGEQP